MSTPKMQRKILVVDIKEKSGRDKSPGRTGLAE